MHLYWLKESWLSRLGYWGGLAGIGNGEGDWSGLGRNVMVEMPLSTSQRDLTKV